MIDMPETPDVPFREFVRKRPGMYVGDPYDGSGSNHVILELVANAVDQFLIGEATRVVVGVEGRRIIVEDDGSGVPFRVADEGGVTAIERHLEIPHVGATAERHAPHVHAVFRGLGLAVVNPLCSGFEIWSSDGTSVWTRAYKAGAPEGDAQLHDSKTPQGTRVTAELDEQLLSLPDLGHLARVFANMSYLYPGLHLALNGRVFFADGGLSDLVSEAGGRIILWRRETFDGAYRMDVSLGSAPDGLHRSWVNGVETVDGGTHMRALDRALGLLGWASNVRLFHLIMEDPKFAGPTRDELHVPELEDGLVHRLVQILRSSANSG